MQEMLTVTDLKDNTWTGVEDLRNWDILPDHEIESLAMTESLARMEDVCGRMG